TMFLNPIASSYQKEAKIVAFCDPSRIRMQYHVDELQKKYDYREPVALYDVDDFDRMLAEHKPDSVIICSVDATHADYIVRSVEAGCDVIVEKPIAINAGQCASIQKAVGKTGKNIRVAFNYRWSPGVTKVWEVLSAGTIGTVHHVQFEYLLNTDHGADYFRRWHSQMACSGGLLVHKSTHHFDLVNWWIDSIPDTIFAHGKLCFYGKENAIKRGEAHLTAYERYLDPASKDDPFRLDLLASGPNILYHEAEKDSGYIRDRNVFRDGIDIYDTMSVAAKYRSGAFLTYSLMAYAPHEGFSVAFTGDRGRIEYSEAHGSHLIMGQSDSELAMAQEALPEGRKARELHVFPHFGKGREVELPPVTGGHGGGDLFIQEQMFSAHPQPDHARRGAGWEQGMASAMLGISANQSIQTGQAVRLTDLLPLNPEALRLSELI
ncbi:MAG: Gfo/Idh/MocA family protein, partial [Terrimicrobiaceae bacterium]